WFKRWLFSHIGRGNCTGCMLVNNPSKHATCVLAVSFLLFPGTLFSSGLMGSEHHLVALLPLSDAMTAVAGFGLGERYPASRWGAVTLAVIYAACAFQWQTAAVAGLKKTGGVGVWSDGVIALAMRLESNFARADIKFLDWGFQQNIYT